MLLNNVSGLPACSVCCVEEAHLLSVEQQQPLLPSRLQAEEEFGGGGVVLIIFLAWPILYETVLLCGPVVN